MSPDGEFFPSSDSLVSNGSGRAGQQTSILEKAQCSDTPFQPRKDWRRVRGYHFLFTDVLARQSNGCAARGCGTARGSTGHESHGSSDPCRPPCTLLTTTRNTVTGKSPYNAQILQLQSLERFKRLVKRCITASALHTQRAKQAIPVPDGITRIRNGSVVTTCKVRTIHMRAYKCVSGAMQLANGAY